MAVILHGARLYLQLKVTLKEEDLLSFPVLDIKTFFLVIDMCE